MLIDPSALVAGVRDGDRRALARAMTLVESGSALGEEISQDLAGQRKSRVLVGFTGAPGVGKSTLVNALTAELRQRGERVAVAAVDPSSPLGGGALLGDRLRMMRHHGDDGVFIRSFSSRGQLGGLSAAIPACVAILAAAPFDWLLLETVGVGQSEVDICSLADVTVVVTAPGMGDGVQADKAGLYELADVFVVNKADLPDASKTAAELKHMLALGRSHDPDDWKVPIIKTNSEQDEGVADLVAGIENRLEWMQANGVQVDRERDQSQRRLLEETLAGVRTFFADQPLHELLLQAAAERDAGRPRAAVLADIFTYLGDRQSALLRTQHSERV